jgi:molecular chaperone DnaK (HSP70)
MNLLRKLNPFSKSPKFSVGLDFGTTMSRLCYIPRRAGLYRAPPVQPVRSLVSPKPTGGNSYRWIMGGPARNQGEFFSRFKLKMGTMQPIHPDGDSESQIAIRSEIIAARVMWDLYERARRVNNTNLPKHSDVTVTVPAEWSAQKREATIAAAKIAGFKIVTLIEEPVAAYLTLMEYEIDQRLTNARNVMVFDYGGGTLDITIIHKPDDRTLPYVIGRAMQDEKIGGEHIDRLLCRDLVVDKKVAWDNLSPQDQFRLADITRQLKEFLNPRNLDAESLFEARYRESFDLFDIDDFYEPGEIVLVYDEMREKLESTILRKVEKCIWDALHSAGLSDSQDIDSVIMAGGSSYLRVVHDLIREIFVGKDFGEGVYLDEPEKIVAVGAALYQLSLDRKEQRFQLRVPMRTYLECPGDDVVELANVQDILPLKPKAPPTYKIPRGTERIRFLVKQEHTYSGKQPDTVEQVRFEGYSGKADRLRLEYEIDPNGRFVNWKPALIIHQSTKLITGTSRQYDWLDIDYTEKANEYTIHKPDPLSEDSIK